MSGTVARCRRCRWEIRDSDRYCSLCGALQRELTIAPSVLVLAEDGESAEDAAALGAGELELANSGWQGFFLLSIEAPPDWSWHTDPPLEEQFVLAPGARLRFEVESAVEGPSTDLFVRILTSVGELRVPVRTEPLPPIRLTPKEIPLVRGPAPREVELELALDSGVEEIGLHAGSEAVELVEPVSSIQLTGGVPRKVRLRVRPNEALEHSQHLTVELPQGLRFPLPLLFVEAVPGRLALVDPRTHLEVRLFPREEELLEIELMNFGVLDAVVTSAAVTTEEGEPFAGAGITLVASDGKIGETPLPVASEERLTVQLHLQAEESLGALRDGTLRIGLAEGPSFLLPIRVDSREPAARHPHAVGFDFGTSVSAVATRYRSREVAGRVAPVPLASGGNALVHYLPSDVAIFRAVESSDLIFRLNWEREPIASGTRGRELAVARDLKRRIALSADSVESVFFDGVRRDVSVEDLALHVVREMKKRAERFLDARIPSVIATHPTRFSFRRIQAIRDLFDQAGFAQVRLLDEATAAGILGMYRQFRDRDHYTMLVYDMGGGTTDVTLFEVRNRRKQGVLEIHPSVLGVTGDPKLGGRDLTQAMVDRFLAAQPENTHQQLLLPGRRGVTGTLVEIAQRNQRDLFNRLEQLKLDLFTRDEPERKADLSYYGSDGRQVPFPTSPSFSRDEVNQLLLPRFELLWQEIVHLLDLCEIETLDVIYLAGRSSALPSIRYGLPEYLAKQKGFARLEAVLAENDGQVELKGAVSLGACLAEDLLTGVTEKLVLERLDDRTASRFGFRIQDGSFLEVLPRGSRFGDTSEVVAVPIGTPTRSDLYELRLEVYENPTLDPSVDGNPEAELIGIVKLDVTADEARLDGDATSEIRLRLEEDRRVTLIADVGEAHREIEVVP